MSATHFWSGVGYIRCLVRARVRNFSVSDIYMVRAYIRYISLSVTDAFPGHSLSVTVTVLGHL